MPIAPPDSTLQAIQTKVRRLTRSPSEAQLSTTDLQNYINTFILYDFPEHLRTFNLRQTFTFFCNPYQSEYNTDEASFDGVTNNPLYNFQNKYITVHPPVYIAGYQVVYSESREQFFNMYPKVNNISSIGPAGNGVTTMFTGVINSQQAFIPPNVIQKISLLPNQVLFSSVGTNNEGLAMIDVPLVDPVTGNPRPIGNLYEPDNLPTVQPTVITPENTINYVTGQYVVTFKVQGTPTPPGAGQPINSQTVPQVVSLPQAMLYYDNKFVLRPVPDQPYRVNFEVYVRPTQFLETNQSPQLEEWWQYIAYGAAKKVFEDRLDMDSVALIMQEYKKQEALCLRRTIVQYTSQRTATIYTEQTSGNNNNGMGWGPGNGNF